MAMVDVRVMRMLVSQRFMPVPVRMRLGHRPLVHMAMMVVVDVAVLMLDRLMRVVVLMAFGQMQPEAKRHQRAGEDKLSRERLA